MFMIEHELLNGIIVLQPSIHADARGWFAETYRADAFIAHGLPTDFMQDNHSRSKRGVIRGLHFQWQAPMGKLLRVTRGSVQLVELDIRPNSPTCGQHVSIDVSEHNARIVWVPPGFANGFCVTSDEADVLYKCTALYNPNGESGIRYNDPALGITWQTDTPIVSDRDANAQTLEEWLERPEAALLQ
jgi:dTDP-4-dehydrorhamnose 3,5-epimerase